MKISYFSLRIYAFCKTSWVTGNGWFWLLHTALPDCSVPLTISLRSLRHVKQETNQVCSLRPRNFAGNNLLFRNVRFKSMTDTEYLEKFLKLVLTLLVTVEILGWYTMWLLLFDTFVLVIEAFVANKSLHFSYAINGLNDRLVNKVSKILFFINNIVDSFLFINWRHPTVTLIFEIK